MKNLLEKHMLLALLVGISMNYVSSMIATEPEELRPLDQEYQEILDDVVKKLKAGNPGDFKGYTRFNAYHLAKTFIKDKAIVLDHNSLYTLPKNELKFLLGRQTGYTLPNMDQNYAAEQATKRADMHGLGFSFLGSAVGALSASRFSKRNDWSAIWSCVVCVAGCVVGSLTFQAIADYCGYNREAYIASDLQKIEYDLDEMSAEKLDCHDAAISFIGTLADGDNLNQKIKRTPLNKDRIARIQKLIDKKQQQVL